MNTTSTPDPTPTHSSVPATAAAPHVPLPGLTSARRAIAPVLVGVLALAPAALLALIPLLGIR